MQVQKNKIILPEFTLCSGESLINAAACYSLYGSGDEDKETILYSIMDFHVVQSCTHGGTCFQFISW